MSLRMMVTSITKNENATKPLPSPLSKIPLNYGGDGGGRLNLIPLPLVEDPAELWRGRGRVRVGVKKLFS